jgi:hypothetical protein
MTRPRFYAGLASGLLAIGFAVSSNAFADDDDTVPPPGAGSSATHYGLFGLLDSRSKYGHDWFPEPFRVEDSDVGNEARFDWEHNEARHFVGDTVQAEVEKSFGLMTLEIQVPYTIDATPAADGVGQDADRAGATGFGDISLSARHPLWQYVSPAGLFDNTMGGEVELGVPTNSPPGKNTEIAPGIFDDLKIGEHFSLQSLFAMSWILGSRPQGGTRTFDYAVGFGWSVEDEEFAIPRVERLTPMLEMIGETTLDGSSAGHNSLTGTLGFRAEMKSIGGVQPQIGLAYLFPIDKGGRDDLRWGVITSVVFEY